MHTSNSHRPTTLEFIALRHCFTGPPLHAAVQVIRKQTLDPAMLSALKVQSWPTWENTTGGW
jgi:hypothetical protein